MFTSFFTTAWEKFKAFIGWRSGSETIIWARVQALGGAIVAGLGAIDWSPLIGLASGGGFDQTQVIVLGVILVTQGVVTEVARRARDWNLNEIKDPLPAMTAKSGRTSKAKKK